MKRVLLYYPSFDIPSKDKLNGMLIFSDGIKTINPLPKINYNELDEEYQFLIEAGEYEPIYIYEVLKNKPEVAAKIERTFLRVAPKILSEFIKYSIPKEFLNTGKKNELDYESEQISIIFPSIYDFFCEHDFFGYKSGKKSFVRSISTHLHKSSISNFFDNLGSHALVVANEFIRRQISSMEMDQALKNFDLLDEEKDARIRNRLNTQSAIGLLFAASIIEHINELLNDLIVPICDDVLTNRFLTKFIYPTQPVINYYVNQFLPKPIPNIDTKMVVHFKEKRRDELLNFRNTLLDFEKRLSEVHKITDLKRIALSYQSEIEKESNTIKKLLNESKIHYTIDSLSGVLQLKSPNLINSLITGGVASTLFSNPMAGILTGGVSFAISSFAEYAKEKNKIKNSPFSYVYYAQKANIIE